MNPHSHLLVELPNQPRYLRCLWGCGYVHDVVDDALAFLRSL